MKRRLFSRHAKSIRYLAAAIVSTIFTTIPVSAAEKIDFYFPPISFPIKISSLETFAKDGTVNRDLQFYLGRVSPEVREQFREALLRKEEVNPVHLYRFFSTPIGERVLSQVGDLINIQGGGNSKYALRAALFKAANHEEGFTLLNFLRQFPTNIQLDASRILEVVNFINEIVDATDVMVARLKEVSSVAASTQKKLDFSAMPDVRIAGKTDYSKETIVLKDNNRKREFQVDLYKPETTGSDKIPVAIASHGLASNPQNFVKVARHLASHGYLVAALQHPGSDSLQLQAMLNGYARDIFELNEFIDRPLDVSYLLDELERRNPSEFGGRLELKKVGIMGHSFGGYTALVLAGGRINFERLEKDCNRIIWDPNLSLLVQCRALDLPRQDYDLRDSRIAAAIAMNPFTSSIFGAEGLSQIKIPVALVAGSDDFAAPAFLEQFRSFAWLSGADKYLVLEEGQTHIDISQLDAGATTLIQSLPALQLPDPQLLDGYGNAVALSFFGYYLDQNPDYRTYLQPSYAKYISQEPFDLYIVEASSESQLSETLLELNGKVEFLNR